MQRPSAVAAADGEEVPLPADTFDEATGQTTFAVRVAPKEFIRYSVVVDTETGLDVDPQSGRLQPREETIANVREVYAVGKEALGADLERYNKWIAQNPDKERKLFGGNSASKRTAAADMMDGGGGGAAAREPYATRPSAAAEPVSRRSAVEDLTAKAEQLKSQGNLALQRGDNKAAVRRYSEGIAVDSGVVALWANRAEAYLRMKRFGEALADADHAIAITNGDHEKALFRRVAALRGLRRFQDAHAAAELGEAAFGGNVWDSVLREAKASPSLILDAVIDTQDLSAGSAGFCAVVSAERVVTSEAASDATVVGTLPVTLAWMPAMVRRTCPELVSVARGGCDGTAVAWSPSDVVARVAPALLLQLVKEAASAPTHVSPLPTGESIEQHVGLLGSTVEVGTSDAHLEAVDRALDVAAHVIDVSSSFAAECEAAGLSGAAVAAFRDRFAADGPEALAPLLVAIVALSAAEPLVVAATSGDAAVEVFVAQAGFFDPRRNPAFGFVSADARATVRLAPEPSGSVEDQTASSGGLLDASQYHLRVSSATLGAATVGKWLVDSASTCKNPAQHEEGTRAFDWYAA